MTRGARLCRSGVTLIELLVVTAVVGTLVTLTAPSFKRMIDVQRLRSVNAGLITDLQFARSEAASRNLDVKVMFDKTGGVVTCYVLLTGDHAACNCNNQPGVNVCNPAVAKEIRTVQVDRSLGIVLGTPGAQTATTIRTITFDPATGRIKTFVIDDFYPPAAPFVVEVANASVGGFKNSLEATGRPTVCTPSGQISGVTTCP